MLVDSFSFTHDETAPSVDSQAQLLVEAGWRVSRRRLRGRAARPVTCDRPHGSTEDHDDDMLYFDEAARTRY